MDIDDGVKPGAASEATAEIDWLDQELREIKRANEILKGQQIFGAVFYRQHS